MCKPLRTLLSVHGSAGGLTPLIELIQSLPEDFTNYIFIVVHIPPHSPSQLPEILGLRSSLKAVNPKDGEKLQQGTVYIAWPDHYLILEQDHVLVRRAERKSLCHLL